MDYSLKLENREFVRVKTSLPVSFKFLGDEKDFPDLGKTFEGAVLSIGGGGLLLEGSLSERAWIPRFILQKIIIGVTFELPREERPIAALCRVAWVEDSSDKRGGEFKVQYGLKFREISMRDLDRIFDFVIHSYMQ